MPVQIQLSNGTDTKPIIGAVGNLNFTNASSATTSIVTDITTIGGNKISLYNSLWIVGVFQGGLGGTMDVILQGSPDGGTTWVDIARFIQITTTNSTQVCQFTLSRSAESSGVTATATGTNAPVMSAGTKLGGDFGDRLRLKVVTNSGVNTGKSQQVLIYANP